MKSNCFGSVASANAEENAIGQNIGATLFRLLVQTESARKVQTNTSDHLTSSADDKAAESRSKALRTLFPKVAKFKTQASRHWKRVTHDAALATLNMKTTLETVRMRLRW